MYLEKLTLRRTRKRQYEDRDGRRRVLTPTEYAIFRAGVKLASIVFNGKGWRACLPNENSKFGLAISPVGLDKFKAVKSWSFEYFEKEEKKKEKIYATNQPGLSGKGI